MVSDGKLLFEFANGKLGRESSCGAETYALLKAIYYFIENGIGKEKRIYLHSDNPNPLRADQRW